MKKEAFLLVLAANLVLTVVVVGAGLALFAPDTRESAPADTAAFESEAESLRREAASLRDRIAELEVGNQDQALRIARLERAASTVREGGDPSLIPAEPVPEADAAERPSPEEEMRKAIEGVMRSQARKHRDRYINELLNPTAETDARQLRQVQRITDMISQNLGLEPRDRASVERILTEVDQNRRRQFRALAESKPNPDDISYDEVKKVLDESFAEEDRLIADTLPEDKAKEYNKSAQPFRQLIYMGARTAFTPPENEK